MLQSALLLMSFLLPPWVRVMFQPASTMVYICESLAPSHERRAVGPVRAVQTMRAGPTALNTAGTPRNASCLRTTGRTSQGHQWVVAEAPSAAEMHAAQQVPENATEVWRLIMEMSSAQLEALSAAQPDPVIVLARETQTTDEYLRDQMEEFRQGIQPPSAYPTICTKAKAKLPPGMNKFLQIHYQATALVGDYGSGRILLHWGRHYDSATIKRYLGPHEPLDDADTAASFNRLLAWFHGSVNLIQSRYPNSSKYGGNNRKPQSKPGSLFARVRHAWNIFYEAVEEADLHLYSPHLREIGFLRSYYFDINIAQVKHSSNLATKIAAVFFPVAGVAATLAATPFVVVATLGSVFSHKMTEYIAHGAAHATVEVGAHALVVATAAAVRRAPAAVARKPAGSTVGLSVIPFGGWSSSGQR